MGKTVADFEALPDWFLDMTEERFEGTVDGVRWIANKDMMIAVDGGTWSLFPGSPGEALSRPEVMAPLVKFAPGAPELIGHAKEPNPDAEDTGLGALVGHYVVPMGANEVRMSLCYYGLVTSLFGSVTWWGSGPQEPIVAKVGDVVVAVVMPVIVDAETTARGEAEAAVLRPR